VTSGHAFHALGDRVPPAAAQMTVISPNIGNIEIAAKREKGLQPDPGFRLYPFSLVVAFSPFKSVIQQKCYR
jgi:hypothetical protein